MPTPGEAAFPPRAPAWSGQALELPRKALPPSHAGQSPHPRTESHFTVGIYEALR